MNKYYYCVNTFDGDEPVQLQGDIEADTEDDAIQKLIDDNTINAKGYEFLELYVV